jgi:hypothetical protein
MCSRCRRAISRSSAIELASTGAMDVAAMWPHKLSDVHVDVLVVWRTRRSKNAQELRDARHVPWYRVSLRTSRSPCGATTLTRYWRSTTADDHLADALGTSSSAIFSLTSGAKLEVGKYGGLTAIAHMRWRKNAAAKLSAVRLRRRRDSVWSVGLWGTSDAYFKPGNIRSVPFVYGRWVTGRRDPQYTDDGKANSRWYKDGVLIDGPAKRDPNRHGGVGRIARLYTTGHRHRCVHGPQASPSTTARCPRGDRLRGQSIGVPGTHTPTSPVGNSGTMPTGPSRQRRKPRWVQPCGCSSPGEQVGTNQVL